MASGRFFLAAALSLSICAALPPALRAQDAVPSDADAKRIQGRITANGVYVRARASEEGYTTMKLKKDQVVTVVGAKGVWLKIVPPPGSFAYVPKSFVTLRLDGTVGRMSREWIARVGSSENELAAEPMATLHEGEDVQVIGQHNEYFKINPPKDSYLWVNKQFVEPIQNVVVAEPKKDVPPQSEKTDAPPADGSATATPDKQDKRIARTDATYTPTTRPAEQAEGAIETDPPTTRPAAYDAIAEYDKLEKQYADSVKKPILEQPLPEMLPGYKKVLESDELPSSMRQIAQIRVASIQVRHDAREKFLAVQIDEKKMTAKQQSLIAERTEIEDRIKQNNIAIFSAVGTLRTSSLQIGNTLLYRLTDPATGRTVAYIRTNDAKYGGMLGQFIGVRGTITSDPQLKSVIENPADVKPVDPAKVNRSIAAQLIPPSLLKTNPPQPTFTAAPVAPPKADQDQAAVDKDQEQN